MFLAAGPMALMISSTVHGSWPTMSSIRGMNTRFRPAYDMSLPPPSWMIERVLSICCASADSIPASWTASGSKFVLARSWIVCRSTPASLSRSTTFLVDFFHCSIWNSRRLAWSRGLLCFCLSVWA